MNCSSIDLSCIRLVLFEGLCFLLLLYLRTVVCVSYICKSVKWALTATSFQISFDEHVLVCLL